MPRVIYLDTGPLGLACYSQRDPEKESGQFQQWMNTTLLKQTKIVVPAIADYELRRELIRNGSLDSIAKLDLIESGRHPDFPGVVYLPLTDDAIKRAADLWAEARNKGYATAHEQALDGDVMIAAQVLEFAGSASRFIVVTTNVKDLKRYVGNRARPWDAITP